MIQYYPIPINDGDYQKLFEKNNYLDMNDIKFDHDNPKRCAFIYIRNLCINSISFRYCSYEDNAEFLKMYMTGDISVNIGMLNHTWMRILRTDNSGNNSPCIFSDEEIERFREENPELVYSARQLAVSMKMVSILNHNYKMMKSNPSCVIDVTDVPLTDYDEINFNNFTNIILSGDLPALIAQNESIPCLNYTKYFIDKYNYNTQRINSRLPYTNMLNMMMQQRALESFLTNLNGKKAADTVSSEEVPG